MYLLDTNIWLELLLNQEKADEVKIFLEKIKDKDLYITSFSLYSICIFLSRVKKYDILENFISDLTLNWVEVINAEMSDIKGIIECQKLYNLDFDDALQYYIANLYEIILISYDADFNKTPEGRITPDLIINSKKE